MHFEKKIVLHTLEYQKFGIHEGAFIEIMEVQDGEMLEKQQLQLPGESLSAFETGKCLVLASKNLGVSAQ